MAVFSVDNERRAEVPGYGGRYEVSDTGKVYTKGYEMARVAGHYVNFCWKGRVERVDVAYLVARAFLPNLEGRPYVVRLDGDLDNCRVENLRWSEKRQPRGATARYRVKMYDLSGQLLCHYGSVSEAARELRVDESLIRKCAIGKLESVKKKYIFRYE